MNHTTLIMLITATIIAAMVGLAYYNLGSAAQPDVELAEPRIEIVNVIAQNITGGEAHHVRISVRTTGGAVRVNDTLISIAQPEGEAALAYRPGALERNLSEGFYTQ